MELVDGAAGGVAVAVDDGGHVGHAPDLALGAARAVVEADDLIGLLAVGGLELPAAVDVDERVLGDVVGRVEVVLPIVVDHGAQGVAIGGVVEVGVLGDPDVGDVVVIEARVGAVAQRRPGGAVLAADAVVGRRAVAV